MSEPDYEYQVMRRTLQIFDRDGLPLESDWSDWHVTAGYNKDGPPVYRKLNHARSAINQLKRYPKKFQKIEYKIQRRTVVRGEFEDVE